MAFYKDFTNKGTREDKRQAAEKRGGFDDEGAHYSGNRPARGAGRPASGGAAPAGRPLRGDGAFASRPSQGGNRPPRSEGSFGNRPPRGDKPAYGDRAPRSEGSFGNRPPRGDKPAYGDRAPRGEGSFGNRPPRGDKPAFGDRAPRGEGNFGNRPPRGDKPAYGDRAPRGEGNFGNRPPRGGDRPSFGDRAPRGEGNFGNRPPRGDKTAYGDRAPRGEGNFGNRPPRGDKPAYGDRAPRFDASPVREEGGFRFGNGGQEPYRSRGANIAAPRPYDERKRERREGPAPRDYNNFHYEAPTRPPRPTYDAPEPAEEEIVPLENLLSGRNPIREALKSGRDIEKLMVARGDLSGSAREIIAMAKEQHVPVQEVDRARLDAITEHHQGMLAFASAYQYHTVEEMLAVAKERGEAPFLVVLDGVTDPHNLGAIIRTAECAGAHGVIVQERRAVGLTPAAVKASAGAIEHIMVARVVNLVSTLETLKKQGVWVYAADMGGEDYAKVDFKGGAAIVIGAEGEGVSRLVLENADKRVSLPVRGKLDSLNASVAAGILLYAVLRAR